MSSRLLNSCAQPTVLTYPPSPCTSFPCSLRYELDLAKPYDYMVARTLLTMANKSEGLEFANVEHASGEVSWSDRRTLCNLSRSHGSRSASASILRTCIPFFAARAAPVQGPT